MTLSSHVDPAVNLFGLEAAPIFHPTEEEFSDPFKYIESIRLVGEKAGICKVIPPAGWKPPFSVDQEHFKFRSRIQRLNTLDGRIRPKVNFLESLELFWDTQGKPLTQYPAIDKTLIDLFDLSKEVTKRGGHQKVTELKQWPEVAHALKFKREEAMVVATEIKQIHSKYIVPFEAYLSTTSQIVSPERATGSMKSMKSMKANPKPTKQTGEDDVVKMEVDSPAQAPSTPRGVLHVPSSSQTTSKKSPPKSKKTGSEANCELCDIQGADEEMLLCDGCDRGFHMFCLTPPLSVVPKSDWFCPECLGKTGEFGFEDGKFHSLASFKQKADTFKRKHFAQKSPNSRLNREPSEYDVEKEFWRLVETPYETVEVEYGADIHTSNNGSGFPSVERQPLDPYSTCPWNLTNLSVLPDSMFCHIRSDISGMMVPWLYVGMCFSTFCWHNEDHYTYSINYLHWGDTKTWYGVPGSDAEAFETAMKECLPDLFEDQPDLLFHLVTTLSPKRLKEKNVKVFLAHQHEGEFVITFPQAYHAGFNQGYNCAEAVNFATVDWFKFGSKCVEKYREFKKEPCFSHDELLLTVLTNDKSIILATELKDELISLRDREISLRAKLLEKGARLEEMDPRRSEDSCFHCNALCHLSFVCAPDVSPKVTCLLHAEEFGVEISRLVIKERITEAFLAQLIEDVTKRVDTPRLWSEKLRATLQGQARPPLKMLQALLAEGEKIPAEIEEVKTFRQFLNVANEWVDKAVKLVGRKTKKRKLGDDSASERKPTLEEVEALLNEYETLPFESPEHTALVYFIKGAASFRDKARQVLLNLSLESNNLQELKSVLTSGKSLDVHQQEVEELEKRVNQLEFIQKAKAMANSPVEVDYEDLSKFLAEADRLEISKDTEAVQVLIAKKKEGEAWNQRVNKALKPESNPSLDLLRELATSCLGKMVSGSLYNTLVKHISAAEAWLDSFTNCWGRDDYHPNALLQPEIQQGQKHAERSPNQLRKLQESHKLLLTPFPAEAEKLSQALQRFDSWDANARQVIMRLDKGSLTFDQLLRIMWRTAVIAGEGKGFAPVLVPENGQYVRPAEVPEPVTCFCKLNEAKSKAKHPAMITCRACAEQFHVKCVGATKKELENNAETYLCPFCDDQKELVYFSNRPTIADLRALLKEGEGLDVRVDDLKLIRALVTQADSYCAQVNNAVQPPCEYAILRRLIQAGKALEIKLDDGEMHQRLSAELWRLKAQEVLAMASGDRLEKIQKLLEEGAKFKHIEREVEELHQAVIAEHSAQWQKNALKLLENPSKEVVQAARQMVADAKGLNVEPLTLQKLQDLIAGFEKKPSASAKSGQQHTKGTQRKQKPSQRAKEANSGVYCICRVPNGEFGTMIACDDCEEWFHIPCVGVSEEVAAALERYSCPSCCARKQQPYPFPKEEKSVSPTGELPVSSNVEDAVLPETQMITSASS